MRYPWSSMAPGWALALVCTAAPLANAAGGPITIGVITEITPSSASYGRDLLRGAEMAVRDVNAEGGIGGQPLTLVVVDGGANPARSAIMMRRLVAGESAIIVGGWGSAQVLANLEIAEQAAMPYIVVGATHPAITSPRNRWTFRVIQTDAVQAEQLARVVSLRLRAQRVAVVSDGSAYGTGSRDVFLRAMAELGSDTVANETYVPTDGNAFPQIERLRQARPDVIALFGTLPGAAALMNQARAAGVSARFVGTGGLATEALLEAAPVASEGTLVTSFFHEAVDAQARAWAERYRREFAGSEPPPRPQLGAWEYRAIHDIAAPCLRRAGPDREGLRACIAGWSGKLFSVAGEAHFDATGQLVQAPLLVEVRGGRFTLWRQQP